MEILRDDYGIISSIWHQGNQLNYNEESYYDFPLFNEVDFKETYFLLPVVDGSLIFTKSGIFRHPKSPHRLCKKIMGKKYVELLEFGLNEVAGKRCCLKPFVGPFQCLQGLYRHRNNPPVLNLCLLENLKDGVRQLEVTFPEYTLYLNDSYHTFLGKIKKGMTLVKSYHLFISGCLTQEMLNPSVLFQSYPPFIRRFLVQGPGSALFLEEILAKGAIQRACKLGLDHSFELFKKDNMPPAV